MGYYTRYTLEAKNVNQEQIDSIVEWLKKKDLIGYAFDSDLWSDLDNKTVTFWPYDECKWYDAETDIEELGRLMPDVTFKLTGSGEDDDDYWNFYVKGEQTELVQAVMPPPKTIKW